VGGVDEVGTVEAGEFPQVCVVDLAGLGAVDEVEVLLRHAEQRVEPSSAFGFHDLFRRHSLEVGSAELAVVDGVGLASRVRACSRISSDVVIGCFFLGVGLAAPARSARALVGGRGDHSQVWLGEKMREGGWKWSHRVERGKG
jgi:hypothetical protein